MLDEKDPRVVLARERTEYANERTLWAYVRTSIGLFILIVILFGFSARPGYVIYGVNAFLFIVAMVILVHGIRVFIRRRRRLDADRACRRAGEDRSDLL